MNLISIRDAYIWGADQLKLSSSSTPLLDSQVLLAKALNMSRLEIFCIVDQKLKKNKLNIYKKYIFRRLKGEPVSYITKNREFMSLLFNVKKGVLIPRQETELLTEKTIDLLKNLKSSVKIIEAGTGCGNISISLAKNIDNSQITTYEISKESARIARNNINKFRL